MEGFFTDDEMDTVVSYIHDRFGRIVSQPNGKTFGQVRALGSLISYYLIEGTGKEGDVKALQRFVKLCYYCGAIFKITLKDGTVVAA